MSTGATVSVVTAAHNAASHIERCIGSVADQTRAALEHVIVDDGSTDGTAAIVQDLASRHAHVTLLRQHRQGAAVARNQGIRYASGRYIAFLDSDDYWLPEKLECQIGFMEETGALFSYGDYSKCDARTGRVVARYRLPPSLGYADLLDGCPIGCLTAAYNQQELGKRLMPEIRRGQDWGLWLALTRDGTRAWKYPGDEAVYNVDRRSLSRRKLLKSLDLYRIYRHEEGLSTARTIWHMARHAAYVARK